MAFRFNPLTGSLDLVVPAGTPGDSWSDPVDSSITLDADITYDIADATNSVRDIYLQNIKSITGSTAFNFSTSSTKLVSNLLMDDAFRSIGNASSPILNIFAKNLQAGTGAELNAKTDNSSAADAVATLDVNIRSGDKTAGTGDSGGINIKPGTSAGGAVGTVNLGGIKHAYESLNTTQTLTLDQTLINTVGTITLTLPAVSGLAGKYYTFVHTGTSFTDIVTIDGDGTETINGALTYKLHSFGESVTLYCDGAIWRVSGRYIPSVWASYTPTFTGFGTATNIEFVWRRTGDSVEIRGKFTSGTSTATEARVSLPSNITSGTTAKIPSIQLAGLGVFDANSATQPTVLIEPSVTYMTFGSQAAGSAGLTKLLGSGFMSSGTGISFTATSPATNWEG